VVSGKDGEQGIPLLLDAVLSVVEEDGLERASVAD
jgi:hypothetical protein